MGEAAVGMWAKVIWNPKSQIIIPKLFSTGEEKSHRGLILESQEPRYLLFCSIWILPTVILVQRSRTAPTDDLLSVCE